MSGVVGDDGRELTGLGGFESASEKGLDYRKIVDNDFKHLLHKCMTRFAKSLVYVHPIFQLCRAISQTVVKLELGNFNQSIFYHQAFMKANFYIIISKLCLLTVAKLDVCIRPLFANLVTNMYCTCRYNTGTQT